MLNFTTKFEKWTNLDKFGQIYFLPRPMKYEKK